MIPRATMMALLPICVLLSQLAVGQAQLIPHHQDKPPGPALTPEEAVKKMTVPPGFTVEVVASEPDIVNPVAMTFDERGRVWITESLEYPRRSPGPGRDRVKVLEDTDGDGKADKFTVFAEGLNIPSGIAVGHGGVWVANAPDILFLQDTDGDGKADKREVVVTGFGRTDTHELPNSLTWGPDGWLYGINGVFNFSHVKHKGKEYEFTCALFRIHPRTRDFELFAEGTSNPWGVAWDHEGSAFFSACVIDHLWHISESGYYHRQGGPYPPFTWKIGSIVKHKHQKAAYCGIHFFDSDAYPPEYRERLYMGNIHGNCINVDVLERDGSTYFARPNDDFLSANDAWFMPVVQKTGPDGSLYVLDWYDQYHCYQDANRDPQGIDRLKGRLYRVRYKNTPRAFGFDMAKESDERLIERLASPNVYDRDIAQRLLSERNTTSAREMLAKLVLEDAAPRKARMHGLWALVGGGPLDRAFHARLLEHDDPGFRAWGVRAAGNMHEVSSDIAARVAELASDPAPDVKLQVAIAARKIVGLDAVAVLSEVLASCGDDKLIPHIVWQNLHPLLEDQADAMLARLKKVDLQDAPWSSEMLPLLVERLLARRSSDATAVAGLATQLVDDTATSDTIAPKVLAALAARSQSGELSGPKLQALQNALEPLLNRLTSSGQESSLRAEAVLLSATWNEAPAVQTARQWVHAEQQPVERRLRAVNALVAAGDQTVLADAATLLPNKNIALQEGILAALSRLNEDQVAEIVLRHYGQLNGQVRPKAIELLTERPVWTRELVTAVEQKRIPPEALNVNQLRKLQSSKDADLVAKVTKIWGRVRTERNPQREQVVAQMRTFLKQTPGDPHAGAVVYKKVCGQCHKLFGDGQDVGPDITLNGRSNFEQLLSNVFDPSLVIGESYQARTVATADGRILVGLLVEDNPQRIVLKIQGGKLETIPRDNIDQIEVSKLSMMPEDLEKQLKPQDLADLFAYLALERPLDASDNGGPTSGKTGAPTTGTSR